ncbi:MAG: PD-(D/E)XK nuclease family protein [Veillonellaceae bacterium]|nr:PD-(D/E)XK nuclease family protein [Veillonellaceae bacterium]
MQKGTLYETRFQLIVNSGYLGRSDGGVQQAISGGARYHPLPNHADAKADKAAACTSAIFSNGGHGGDRQTWHISGTMGEMIMNTPHLSYSSISQLMMCPKQWYITRTYGIYTPQNDHFAFGTAVHRVIQHEVITGWKSTTEVLRQQFDTEYRQAWGENYETCHTAKNYAYFDSLITNELSMTLLRTFTVSESDQIERKITFYAPGVPVPVIGYIDILQDNGVPVDIKTSSTEWTTERAEDELQPLYYLTGLTAAGDDRHAGQFIHLVIQKQGENDCCVYMVQTTRSDWTQQVNNIVRRAWEMMQLQVWWSVDPPVPACGTCPAKAQEICARIKSSP